MDTLSESQIRLINEFRERVKQSEQRLRDTLDLKEAKKKQTQVFLTEDDQTTKVDEQNSSLLLYNPIRNKQSERHSPIPQRLLKPIVFNGSPYSPNDVDLSGQKAKRQSRMKQEERESAQNLNNSQDTHVDSIRAKQEFNDTNNPLNNSDPIQQSLKEANDQLLSKKERDSTASTFLDVKGSAKTTASASNRQSERAINSGAFGGFDRGSVNFIRSPQRDELLAAPTNSHQIPLNESNAALNPNNISNLKLSNVNNDSSNNINNTSQLSYAEKLDNYIRKSNEQIKERAPLKERIRDVEDNFYYVPAGNSRLSIPSIKMFESGSKEHSRESLFHNIVNVKSPTDDRYRAFKKNYESDYYGNYGSNGKFKKLYESNIENINTSNQRSFDSKRLSGIHSPPENYGGPLETFGRPGQRQSGDNLRQSRDHGSIRRISEQYNSKNGKLNRSEIFTADNYKISAKELKQQSPMREQKRPRSAENQQVKKKSVFGNKVVTLSSKKKIPPKSVKMLSGGEKPEQKHFGKSYIELQKERERKQNEPHKLCKEMLRRIKLGTLDQNKFVSILEDHMKFSTRFYQNVKELVNKH